MPWNIPMSIMIDVMRDSKSSFEKQIHDTVAPHLLDVDGDSAHHVHDSAKQLCKPFDNIWKVFVTIFILILSGLKICENTLETFA